MHMRNRPDDRHASGGWVAALAIAVLISAGALPALAQQEPSWTDRMGDFFKRFVPGGGPPEPAQQPPAQPPAVQSPAALPPATPQPSAQAPAARAPAAPAPAAQAPAGQAAPAPAQAPAAEAPAPPPPARASRPEPSLADRVGDFFRRLRPGADTPEPAPRAAGEAPPEEFDCPLIDIREGASTLMVNGPGESSALSLRYQASFVRAARECIVKGKDVTIKVGIQGRVILGPAGSAGELKIPLRYALVWEELGHSKMIWSKLYVVPVTIPQQQPNVEFLHVEDDMIVPIPKAAELENYMIYIGFDPNGAPIEPRKSPPKPKPKKPPG
jgi:hypothetical protein